MVVDPVGSRRPVDDLASVVHRVTSTAVAELSAVLGPDHRPHEPAGGVRALGVGPAAGAFGARRDVFHRVLT